MSLNDFPTVAELSLSDKLRLVELLWDNIRESPSPFPVPESHKKALNNRLETLDPNSLLTLDDLKSRVEARK